MGWRSILPVLAAFPCLLKGELLPIRAYSTADGLPADHINCVVPDSRGFLWFCTQEGLSRFDGYRFINYDADEGLAHTNVSALIETRAGEYFVGTERGISQINPSRKGARFITYTPEAGALANRITALRESRSGRIWCATTRALYEWDKSKNFRRRDVPLHATRGAISDVLELPNGEVWVATTSGIFVLGNSGIVRSFGEKDGVPGDRVDSLLFDSTGRIWAAARNGLALFRQKADGGWIVAKTFTSKSGLSGAHPTALAESTDGTLWVATNEGISRIALTSDKPALLANLGREQGLTDRQVNVLAKDHAGNIWAGTGGAGVMRIGRVGFTTYREQDGLPTDRVWSVFEDRAGELLAVTITGPVMKSLNILDGTHFRRVPFPIFNGHATWVQNRILLQARSGEWWAATNQGLCRFGAMPPSDLGRRQPKTCYAPETTVYQVFEDSKGGVWGSAQSKEGDELMRWDPRTNALITFAAPRVPKGPTDDVVNSFAEDRQGNIWMGLYKNGLYRYDGREFRHFQPSDGVPGGLIYALLTAETGLWIASNGGGLGRIENTGAARPQIEIYNTARGLSSNTIQCLVEDDQHAIYAGTGRGLDRLDPKTGHIQHFSTADGLGHGVCTSAVRDRSGSLWFATTQGLSKLIPEAERPPIEPRVFITDLRVGSDAYPISQAGESRVSGVELKPSQNQFQVEFVGLDSDPGDVLRYRYKLEGVDTDWGQARRQQSVNYAALSPGSYRFLVKAVTSVGSESAVPAEVDFTVLPPFWKRWWFQSLAALGALALVTAVHRYRVAQLVNLERMRTAIATDLHDDIGATLSQIAILSEVARVGASGRRPPGEPLERVAVLAREVVDSMSDIVWSIRSEPHGMESLFSRMRQFALDLLGSREIEFQLRTSPGSENVELSLQERRQILLMFKEAVHNAARHSGCTLVVAELKVMDRELVLTITDDGRGLRSERNGSMRSGGNGIPSMRSRAESLGGHMDLISSDGQGCTVVIRLPAHHRRHAKVTTDAPRLFM
jgi:ligand-binding sensor domain-containing protein/signal transduction histidine kinase